MARARVNTTKVEIIRVATKMFLEKGYSSTSVKSVCDELEISTGNFTFYFPTKEHVLAVLVEMLCEFQREMMQAVVEEGNTSLLALCLELATMASACDEDEIAKDFFISAYSHPITLEIIRKNDSERAVEVFGEYCSDWDINDFAEAEIIISGIEYATLMTTDSTVSLENRISGALNSIFTTFCVPAEVRQTKIEKLLALDYRNIGKRVLRDFKEYVENFNDDDLNELLLK